MSYVTGISLSNKRDDGCRGIVFELCIPDSEFIKIVGVRHKQIWYDEDTGDYVVSYKDKTISQMLAMLSNMIREIELSNG